MSSTKRTKTGAAPRWVFLCDGTIPDPRISRDSPEYGKWTIPTLFGIDSRGRLWRDVDTKPVLVGTPPE